MAKQRAQLVAPVPGRAAASAPSAGSILKPLPGTTPKVVTSGVAESLAAPNPSSVEEPAARPGLTRQQGSCCWCCSMSKRNGAARLGDAATGRSGTLLATAKGATAAASRVITVDHLAL